MPSAPSRSSGRTWTGPSSRFVERAARRAEHQVAERHEVAAEHDDLRVQDAAPASRGRAPRRGRAAASPPRTRASVRARAATASAVASGVPSSGMPTAREHRVQADRGLPAAASARSRTRAVGSPTGMWPTSPAKPAAAAHQVAVLDDAGADADGAGEVEQREAAPRGAVVGLGVRRAVGVVADLAPGSRAPGRAPAASASPAALDVEVGRPRDGAVVAADQARHGDVGPDQLVRPSRR